MPRRAWLLALVPVALVVWWCLTPQLICGPRSGTEAGAIGALRTITTSQWLFHQGDKDRDRIVDYAPLRELSDTYLIDPVLGSGEKNGYAFTCRPSPDVPAVFWFATANPVVPRETGDRYFCTNQAGVIFYTTRAAIAPDAGGPLCTIPAGLLEVGK
jgi:hypothetical protein